MSSEYRLGAFANAGTEVQRLAAQAQIAMERETAGWAQLGIEPSGQGLDVGCGPGFAAAALMTQWPGLTMRGIDQDPEAVATASLGITATVGNADALPCEDGSIGVAFSR